MLFRSNSLSVAEFVSIFALANALIQDNKTSRFSILTLFHSITHFFGQRNESKNEYNNAGSDKRLHNLVPLSFEEPLQRLLLAAFFFTALLPLPLHDPRERGRDKYDYHSIDNQCHACDLTDLFPERKRLLSVD